MITTNFPYMMSHYLVLNLYMKFRQLSISLWLCLLVSSIWKNENKNNLSHESSFRFYLWTEATKACRLRAACVHQAWTKSSEDYKTGAPPPDAFLKSVQIVLRRRPATNRRWRCPLTKSYDIRRSKRGTFHAIDKIYRKTLRHSPFIYHASPHYIQYSCDIFVYNVCNYITWKCIN